MSKYIKYEKNLIGKDYVVGDIHGSFSALEKLLFKIGFDKKKDRLFSVGDLVDRGNESYKSLEYLSYPWFYAISGNHEQIIIKVGLKKYEDAYPLKRKNRDGNHWFFELTDNKRLEYIDAFNKLPIVIQIGDIGLVHAFPMHSWQSTVQMAKKSNLKAIDSITRNRREAIKVSQGKSLKPIKGIKTIVVGHTIFKQVTYSGNVVFLDTGYYEDDGSLSVLDLDTMMVFSEHK